MKRVIQYTELEIKRDTYIEDKLNIESYLYFEKKSNTLFTGKSIGYSQIKEVRSERFYKKGKLYREIVYLKDKILQVTNYKNDVKHGKLTGFDLNKNIVLREYYKNGKKEGVRKEFDNKGKLISEKKYLNGVHHEKNNI